MARYKQVVLCRAKPGRTAEFRQWYIERHLPDVRRVPGVVSAELHDIAFQKDYDLDLPAYCLMTIYELETEDPATLLEAIKARAGTAEMLMTDAAERSGLMQAVGSLITRI